MVERWASLATPDPFPLLIIRTDQTTRVLKNSLVTCFIGPFSYENLSGQGTFSTPSNYLFSPR
jgi:hypothetical protein